MEEYNFTNEFRNYLDLLNEFQEKALKTGEQLTEEQFNEKFMAFLKEKTIASMPIETKSSSGGGGSSNKKLDMSYYKFKPGTVLIDDGHRKESFLGVGSLVGHAVIVDEDNTYIIEAHGGGPDKVIRTNLEEWMNEVVPEGGTIYVVWPRKGSGFIVKKWTDASEETGRIAAKNAFDKLDTPYNHNYMNKYTNHKYYCSQLCWRIWDDLGYDLDAGIKTWVTPMELTQGHCSNVIQKITPKDARYK